MDWLGKESLATMSEAPSAAASEPVPRESVGASLSSGWICAIGLMLFAALAYIPALSNGFIWDDHYHVPRSIHRASLEGLWRIWTVIGHTPQYYPMIHTSTWLEYRFFEMNAAGYHVTNVVLHGLNSILFWRLLLRLGVPGAWVAGAIFAVHPVEVETVAWISERKNLMSTLFYLAAMHTYFRYDAPEPSGGERGHSRWYVASLLLFLCALLSKTVTLSFPAAVLLVFWWKRGQLRLRSVRPLLLFFAVGAMFGSLTMWMEKNVVGATGTDWNLGIGDRLLIAGRAVWFYVGKLAWPTNLNFNYERWQIDSSDPIQYLYPLAAGCVILLAWLLRGRIGRGPLTAILFFGGTLVPALGFFDVFPFMYSFVADHFQYLASLGPIALFAGSATWLMRKVPVTLVGTALALLLLLLASMTWNQTKVYESQTTLWSDVLSKNPTSFMAHNNLGVIYQAKGDLDRAIFHARETLRVYPQDPIGHFNLANYLNQAGHKTEAEMYFRMQLGRKALQFRAHANLADLLWARGRKQDALDHYEQALALQPGHPELTALLKRLRQEPE